MKILKRFLLISTSLVWVILYIDILILLPNDHRIGLEEVGSWYRKMCFRNQKVFLIFNANYIITNFQQNHFRIKNYLTCKKLGDKQPDIVPQSGPQSYKQNHIEKWVTSGIKNVHTNIETPEKELRKYRYIFISTYIF